MTKAQLCQQMANHFRTRAGAGNGRRLSRDDAREFLEELQRLCVRELRDTGHFSISKIAKLVVATRRQRRGREGWLVGPYARQRLTSGANGFFGYGPQHARATEFDEPADAPASRLDLELAKPFLVSSPITKR